ncbi:RsiV family protein [Frankia sp. R43]|uniref:RsiV family protein n=1 Tax=Frankia sp. R43 TaxID=269536 RepID=UPI001F3943CC|nr:RsiV family protein [Frankia sp. R43]
MIRISGPRGQQQDDSAGTGPGLPRRALRLVRSRPRGPVTAAVACVLLLGAPLTLVTGCQPSSGSGKSTGTGTHAHASTRTTPRDKPPAVPVGQPNSPTTRTPGGSSAYRITIRNERGAIEPSASYTAQVPVLAGPDAAVVRRVNAAIAEYVSQEKTRTAHETLTLTAGDPHVGARVLALSFGGDRYPPGAAHPSELASGLVFDLRTGDRVTIEDVFTSTDAGLRRLEPVVRAELERRFPDGPTGGVTDPLPANYQQFVVNPKGLVVIVTELPHVLGPQSVLVPWSSLDGLVRPELAEILRS